jgi:polyhydroxyalkanoate synthesis regulator protein
VLTQIIVEEEGKSGQTMLPVSFLRQLISFYGNSLQTLIPGYLDSSMASFARNQEQMREYMTSFGGLFPFGQQFEEMGKQNMALFQNAMKMFSPFKFGSGGQPGSETPADSAAGAKPDEAAELRRIQHDLEAMQRRLGELSKNKPENKPE